MGTYLQEGIEIYSRKYTKKVEFDVNGWRELCRGFLYYLQNLKLTYDESDLDNNVIKSLDRIESICEDLISVARFLRDCRPPEEYLYARVEDEDVCQEMLDALEGDKVKYGEVRDLSPCDGNILDDTHTKDIQIKIPQIGNCVVAVPIRTNEC